MNNFKHYPIAVRDIASKVDRLSYRQTKSWDSIRQMHENLDLDELLSRKAADAIAHEFAGNVLKHATIVRWDEPEGLVMRVDAVALRYDELLQLLYAAYLEGQTEVRRRTPVVGVAT